MDERLISGAGFIAHIQNSCSTEEHSDHATYELPSEASRSILNPANEAVASQVDFPRSLSSLELCSTMCLPLFNSKASDTLSMERILWAMKGGITKKTWSELITKDREHNHLFFLGAPINLEDEVQGALEGFNVEGLFLSARIGEEMVHYSSISAIIRVWLADPELLHEARAFNECYVNPYVVSTRDLATAASTVGAYSQFGTELYASLERTFASWSPTLGGQAPPLFLTWSFGWMTRVNLEVKKHLLTLHCQQSNLLAGRKAPGHQMPLEHLCYLRRVRRTPVAHLATLVITLYPASLKNFTFLLKACKYAVK